MKKEGYNCLGLFESINTYDNKGNKISRSDRDFFGGFNHYGKYITRGKIMLGTDGRFYDASFDFDGDGKLNGYEYSVMDDMVFWKPCWL